MADTDNEGIFAAAFHLTNVSGPLKVTLSGLDGESADLDLGAVVAAGRGVLPLLSMLGGAFSFATSDLSKKIQELEAEGTTSVVEMIAADKEAKTSKKSSSGTRNLKRVYYMLWFVEQLISQEI